MGAGMAVRARKLAGGLLQGAVVFFAALSLRILYGLLLNFPPFFLFDSWWLDCLVFGIAGIAACAFSLYPGFLIRWLQYYFLFFVTLWLVAERFAGRVFLPPIEGFQEADLPIWRNLMAGMYAFGIGPLLRLTYLNSLEWKTMAWLMRWPPYVVRGKKKGKEETKPQRAARAPTTIRLWDIASGRQLLEAGGDERMPRSAFSPDSKLLASVGGDNRSIQVWEVDTGSQLIELAQHHSWINGLVFSSQAGLLTSVGDGSVRVWDVVTGELKRQYGCGLDWYDIAWLVFSPNGSLFALGDRARGGYVWDVARGEILFKFQTTESYDPCAFFSPDGTKLALVVGLKQVHLWEIPSGRETVLQTGGWSIFSLAFSKDGQRLASAESNGYEDGLGMARIWEVASGRLLQRLEGDLQEVRTVAFSPSGNLLATGEGNDHTQGFVHLWDVATGRERLELEAHDHCVDAVAFSPDGQWLAAAGPGLLAEGFSGTVGLWEVGTGKLLREFDHPGGAIAVGFSHNGQTLITGARYR